MKKRFKFAVILLFVAVCFNGLLAGMLAFISAGDVPFTESFWRLFSVCFFAFGGGFVVAVVLLLITKIPEDKTLSYVSGFYYGTLVCAFLLSDYFISDAFNVMVIVSAVISGLATHNIWMRNYRNS